MCVWSYLIGTHRCDKSKLSAQIHYEDLRMEINLLQHRNHPRFPSELKHVKILRVCVCIRVTGASLPTLADNGPLALGKRPSEICMRKSTPVSR